ncbi:MFS transporter [uncultured Desulfosarcina sp.]|uniref:MFS transporter n=1 Tax=uncultured Desulfosarcina sp. TaxID=218289 RepID=UPI0029C6C7CA|nr:MFS transporter [uncultured Desulfosarcina sp.]
MFPIFFLASIFFLNFLSRIILAPLLPTVEQDLGISHGTAGSLFLLISVGYFAALLASGFVSARLLHRRTIVLSSVALGLALYLVAFSHGLFGMRAGLILVGMAAGLYLPSGIASITHLVDPRHWGKALAIHEVAPNLAFVAAPLLAEFMLGWISWRTVLVVLGSLTIASSITFSRFGRGGDFPGSAPGFGACKTLFRLPAFWIMTVLFMLGISSTIGIYTMLPLFLVSEHGMDRSLANELIGLSRLLSIAMALLAGVVNDRLGPKRTLMVVLFLTGTMTILLGLLPGFWLVLLVFVQPLMAVSFFPPAFALLSSVGPPEVRNISVSLAVPMGFMVGGGVMPLFIGLMGDRGSFSGGIAILGGLILAGVLLSAFLKPNQEDRG